MADDPPQEKCIRTLAAIRITDNLDTALRLLAAREERGISEFVKRLFEKHCFGRGASLTDEIQITQAVRALRRDR
jgi:hypothetical protein